MNGARFADYFIGRHRVVDGRAQRNQTAAVFLSSDKSRPGQKRLVQNRLFNIGNALVANIAGVRHQGAHFQIIFPNGAGILEIGQTVNAGRKRHLPARFGQFICQIERFAAGRIAAVLGLIDIK